jgi:cytochrome P450
MTDQSVQDLINLTKRVGDRICVDFNHHDPAMIDTSRETFAQLRAQCPVAWTDALGGYWIVTGNAEVQQVARDDDTFSSENDHITRFGVAHPPMPHWAGMIEMDPPEFLPLRKAFVPWFSPKAAQGRLDLAVQITDYCIDQVIEAGSCDLTDDLAVPIPALLTMDLVGFPFSESGEMADLFHRHTWTPPGTPARDKLNADVARFSQQLRERAAECRVHPTADFLSFMANLEIAGKQLPLDEVAGHALLVLIGGIDTTTALLSNSFIHLQEHPEDRRRLLADPALLDSAFDEYLRFYSPVQGLARTVTRDTTLGGQQLHENDRVWISWAAANLDETVFPEADSVQLDRYPNRHLAFGIGIHRCLGANAARVTWKAVMQRVLNRMPDYVLDLDAIVPFPTIGTSSGWLKTPARFTPGPRVGAVLPY